MKCRYCGADYPEEAKFCGSCGRPTGEDAERKDASDAAGGASGGAPAKGPRKRLVLVVAAVLVIAVGAFAGRALLKNAAYSAAVSKYESGDYAGAEALFSSISDYRDAAEYLTECSYQRAISNLEEGDFERAIPTFEALGDYQGAAGYLEEAKRLRKYAVFNEGIDTEAELYRDIALTTPEAVEGAMEESIYGEWYDAQTGELLTVDAFRVGGRDYGVKSATRLDGWTSVECYYIDEPAQEFQLAPYFEFFDYIGQRVETLDMFDPSGEAGSGERSFRSVNQEEYSALAAQNEEAERNQPAYTDSEIIDMTFSTFKNKIRGNYSGAGVLYHTASYSDAYVTYDWTSRTYVCTLMGEYSTNAFDFWGTSTQTYFVSAEYLDTGSGLATVSFSIS